MAEKSKPLTRPEMMARIRSANTGPEMLVRKGLHAAGFRFRLHVRELSGTPDIVFPKFRCAVFVHGCFWHGHLGCKYYRLPKTRSEFWASKVENNRARDQRNIHSLLETGWRVLIVWECATKAISLDGLVRTIAEALQSTDSISEIGTVGSRTTIEHTGIS